MNWLSYSLVNVCGVRVFWGFPLAFTAVVPVCTMTAACGRRVHCTPTPCSLLVEALAARLGSQWF